MFSKSIRHILFLLVVINLISCSSLPTTSTTQTSLKETSLAISAPAFAIGSIFTQPIDPAGKLFLSAWLDPDGSDFDQYIWDNFTLQSNETITEIDWYGGYDPLKNGMGGQVVDFTIAIYPSIAAGTEPAVANPPLVTYQTGGNAGETSIGMVGNIPMYAYAFTLPASFNAAAGVKYWVHIKAFQHGSSPDWGFAAGTGGNSSHYRWGAGAGGDSGFRTVPGDAAFTLLGLIPATPTDISLSNEAVDENQPANSLVGELTAAHPDPNATFTFSLACANAGVDDMAFNISGINLQTSAPFDYEIKNVFDVCVRVTDQDGLTFDKNFIIYINDLNESPTDISLSNSTVAESQPINTVVGTLTAADPDAGAAFMFDLTCAAAGADDGSFNILGTDLRTFATFDYETKTTYNICIRVTDQGGLTLDKNFTVSINNVNEVPTSILLSNTVVAENQPINTVVGMLTATDPDMGSTFTFSLGCAVASADDGLFNISGANLQTSAIFDYETKSVFDICLSVTDQGGLAFDQKFIVTITNINEGPADISLSANSITENQPINTVIGSLTATDPDAGAILAFSLTCTTTGLDDTSFNILGTNLRTSATFDFETKSNYSICIRVMDQGGLILDKNFVVAVSNLNESPTGISLSANSVNENQLANTVVGALTAADPDASATFAFSLACPIAGVDDASFNILGNDLRTSAIFDYEVKSTYNICIRVTDQGGLTFDKNFTITVNNLLENTAPTDIIISSATVDENQPTNTVVGLLTAIDPDAGATFTFGLACTVTGADDGYFNILGADLRTSATFDFETKSVYNICIRVMDQGGLTFDKNLVVTVNNLFENAAPTDISLSANSVDENQPINTIVGVLTAADPDAGSIFTFSLGCAVAGADDGSFNISGTDLRTSVMFDYETKFAYNICVRVADQGGLTFDENFVITVNNLVENTAPIDILLSNSMVDENQPINAVIGVLSAIDPDLGATFTFSLACAITGVDNGSFNIFENDLRTSAIFDYEVKSTYNICIRVTDQGGLTFDKNFTIPVNNANEMPTGVSISNNGVDENLPINTLVGVLSATDPDSGAAFAFSLACTTAGADDASFNILGSDLRTSATFDYEIKSTYNICVRVTDQGGLSFDRNFTITVHDVDEITNTPGKVTGGGNINLSDGKATFGFVVMYDAGDVNPSGNLTFMDHSIKLRLKASSFTLLYITDYHARITGYASVNGMSNVPFTLDVYDFGEPGSADIFMIQIPDMNGYSVGGVISGGNIQVLLP